MNPRLTRIRAVILLLAALAIVFVLLTRHARAQSAPARAPAAAAAQAPGTPAPATAPATLHGTVVDSAGKPVAGQKLTLHRVNATGGAMVDSATSDDQGRFTVHVPAERDTSAVFFAATRWQGQLYIGTPFKPPVPEGGRYTVVVGVNPVNMGPAAAGGAAGAGMETGPAGGTGAPAPSALDSSAATRWFLAVILALVALGAIGYALLGALRERGRERRRQLLARLAALDERAQVARGEEAARLQRERAELVAELTGD